MSCSPGPLWGPLPYILLQVCLQPVWSSVAAGGAIFPATTNIPAGSGRAVKTQLENITEHNFMQEIGCWRIVKRKGMEWDLHSEYIFLINSLFSGDCDFDFEWLIFKWVIVITFMSISNVIALRCLAKDPIDDKETMVQVMTWCCFVVYSCVKLSVLCGFWFIQCSYPYF